MLISKMNSSRQTSPGAPDGSEPGKWDLSIPACAKINLHLKVLGTRPDGFTEIESLFQTISLSDRIRLKIIPSGIRLSCNHPLLEVPRENLAYQAAAAFLAETGAGGGVELDVEKKIPLAAGLGGGSSDAAAVLKGMNVLYGKPLEIKQLTDLAARLGSDVPFFIRGGTAAGRGRGEIIEPLPDIDSHPVVLVYPGIGVDTAEAYKMAGGSLTGSTCDISIILGLLKKGNLLKASRNLANDLEKKVMEKYPEVQSARNGIAGSGARVAMMTGSGSVCFGIYSGQSQAESAALALSKNSRWQVFSTSFQGRDKTDWGVVKW